MVTIAQALAAKMKFEVLDRRDGVAEIAARSTRTGQVVNPRVGAAVMHAAGVRGAVQRTDETFVVAENAFTRAEADAFERKYMPIVKRIQSRLYDDTQDEFPTAYIIGCTIWVTDGRTSEPLTGEEARSYLTWLTVRGTPGMPREWRGESKAEK